MRMLDGVEVHEITLRLVSTQIAKAEEEARKKRAAALAEAFGAVSEYSIVLLELRCDSHTGRPLRKRSSRTRPPPSRKLTPRPPPRRRLLLRSAKLRRRRYVEPSPM